MKKFVVIFFFILFVLAKLSIHFDKKHYNLSNDPIDVVIPCTNKDKKTLDLCIDGIRKYGKNIRRVIVVSSKPLTDKAEFFDEKLYPFFKRRYCQCDVSYN